MSSGGATPRPRSAGLRPPNPPCVWLRSAESVSSRSLVRSRVAVSSLSQQPKAAIVLTDSARSGVARRILGGCKALVPRWYFTRRTSLTPGFRADMSKWAGVASQHSPSPSSSSDGMHSCSWGARRVAASPCVARGPVFARRARLPHLDCRQHDIDGGQTPNAADSSRPTTSAPPSVSSAARPSIPGSRPGSRPSGRRASDEVASGGRSDASHKGAANTQRRRRWQIAQRTGGM